MKIIALNRSGFDELPDEHCAVDIIPDSAAVLKNRPVFVPDFGNGWVALPMLALRIGRLGRDISPKFADRYVDGVTVALRLMLPSREASRGLLSAMDSTLATGEWIAPDAVDSTSAVAEVDGHVSAPFSHRKETERCVALVSRFMTLKTGDIILTAPVGDPVSVRPGIQVKVSIGTATLGEFRFV